MGLNRKFRINPNFCGQIMFFLNDPKRLSYRVNELTTSENSHLNALVSGFKTLYEGYAIP